MKDTYAHFLPVSATFSCGETFINEAPGVALRKKRVSQLFRMFSYESRISTLCLSCVTLSTGAHTLISFTDHQNERAALFDHSLCSSTPIFTSLVRWWARIIACLLVQHFPETESVRDGITLWAPVLGLQSPHSQPDEEPSPETMDCGCGALDWWVLNPRMTPRGFFLFIFYGHWAFMDRRRKERQDGGLKREEGR